MKRRDFLKLSAALTGLVPLAAACRTDRTIPGSIMGASAQVGHMLRDRKFGEPATVTEQEVVIVGGGVSGLSAARHLTQKGITPVTLLDVAPHMGGNAASGGNAISRYPWGAHYVPVPNNNLTEYLSFLESCGVVSGYNNQGLPIYNEYYLCQDPEERLYLNGAWQDGLVPRTGLSATESAQINRFLALMQGFRMQTGEDGKDAFAIPVDQSSRDKAFTDLDTITMQAWLTQQQLRNPYLDWYVNYCTRDDFGTGYDTISAWAGIHYFASRKGKADNAAAQNVLTWEEGNGFLVHQLLKQSNITQHNQCVAVAVQQVDDGVQVNYYDVTKGALLGIKAKHCIMAVPQFVAVRLLQDEERIAKVRQAIAYTPWMVANMIVEGDLPERSGAPPSWDNVIYGAKGLGYVDATHQQLQQLKPRRNLTYYLPLTGGKTADLRRKAMETSHADWVQQVVADLNIVHPDIERYIKQMDITVWGHAMAQPLPGMIFGPLRGELGASIHNNIHFAHTDLAGVSIFEEAFYQGIRAARNITGA